MNFTSQICTSRSQSERLLALGVKRETADCIWCEVRTLSKDNPIQWYLSPEYIDKYDEQHIPAWSLHRLMTLLMIGDKLGCITHNIHQNNISTYYELVIASIEHLIKIDEFNNEYLEG